MSSDAENRNVLYASDFFGRDQSTNEHFHAIIFGEQM